MPFFNVVVVGAGIAGLTTAIALTHKGHKVTILGKYAENNTMGGPIHLAPNATRVLFEYGLKEVLEKNMILESSGFSFRRYDTGKQISFRPAGVSSSNVKFPYALHSGI
jgi:2-polyprenyl-6-methoxyphenol hydroxylase-like FAD-dependent oxidoreductase